LWHYAFVWMLTLHMSSEHIKHETISFPLSGKETPLMYIRTVSYCYSCVCMYILNKLVISNTIFVCVWPYSLFLCGSFIRHHNCHHCATVWCPVGGWCLQPAVWRSACMALIFARWWPSRTRFFSYPPHYPFPTRAFPFVRFSVDDRRWRSIISC